MGTVTKAALAQRIWRSTHADYRTSSDSPLHPSVMMLDKETGATVLQPLLSLSLHRLRELAAWPPGCECDNTHQQNQTVCRWCWARGRRVPSDPEV